jgi:hypothetical protein
MSQNFLSQFVLGKLTSRVSEYSIIAYTSNYANQIREIEGISKKYRFDGSQGSRDDRKSVGIILGTNSPNLLIRSGTAIDKENRQIINGNSPFIQYHYIVLDNNLLFSKHHPNIVLLLFRLWNSPSIPYFYELNTSEDQWDNSIGKDFLSPDLSSEEREYFDLSNLATYWTNINTRIIILQQLAILLNSKKLVVAPIGDFKILSLLHSTLLLFPAVVRNEIKSAFGTVDVASCKWADLIFKTTKQTSLPSDSILFNCENNTFQGDATADIFKHIYIDNFLTYFEDSPEDLFHLVNHLNTIDDNFTLADLRDSKRILTSLLPANISKNLKINIYYKCILALDDSDWLLVVQELSHSNNFTSDTENIWQSLTKMCLESGYSKRYVDRILIFVRALATYNLTGLKSILQDKFIDSLELLSPLLSCLKDKINEDVQLSEILKPLAKQHIWTAKSPVKSLEMALEYSNYLLLKKQERFTFIDAAILDYNLIVNNFNNILLPLFPYINDEIFRNSNLHKLLVDNNSNLLEIISHLVEWKNDCLDTALEFADKIKLGWDNQYSIDNFCANIISSHKDKISKDDYLRFIEKIVERNISFSDDANTPRFKSELFTQTLDKIKNSLPELVSLISQLKNNSDWHGWQRISFEISNGDNSKHLRFSDKNLILYYPDKVLKTWLIKISDTNVRNEFTKSQIWNLIDKEKIDKAINELASENKKNILILIDILLEQFRGELITKDLLHILDTCWSEQSTLTLKDKNLWDKLSSPSNLIKLDYNCLLRVWKISGLLGIEIIFPSECFTQLRQDIDNANVKLMTERFVENCKTSSLLNNIMEWSKHFGLGIRTRKEIIINYASPEIINLQLIHKLLMDSAECKDNYYEEQLVEKLIYTAKEVDSSQARNIIEEYLIRQYNISAKLLNLSNQIS